MKKIVKVGAGLLLLFLCALVVPKEAEAAKKIKPVKIPNRKTISSYDLTGDGKKDKLLIKRTKNAQYNNEYGYGDEWKIYLNGKSVKTIKDDVSKPKVCLYRVSKKRVYLLIYSCQPNNGDIYDCSLYQVKKNKLVKVADFYKSFVEQTASFHYSVELKDMTAKNMTIICSDQLNSTARIGWKVNYKYTNGKWKKTSNVYTAYYETWQTEQKSGYTAKHKIRAYTSTSLRKTAFVVKRGEKVKIKKICIKNGNTYLQLTKKNGRKGWIKDPKGYTDGYFEEAYFAG